MNKLLLVVATMLLLLVGGCGPEQYDLLLEEDFQAHPSVSRSYTLDISGDAPLVFAAMADLAHGSATVYVYTPTGQVVELALGLTRGTARHTFKNPAEGLWRLEVHVDGNSKQRVTGSLQLGWKQVR